MSRRPFTPRLYQHEIIDFIVENPRCAIWAGMGLGKTVSTLTALDILELTEPGPALVIAPLRVASSTWPDEVAKWEHLTNLRVSAVVGTPEERRAALKRPAEIYATNFDNLPWIVEHFGDKWPFRKVVADESTKLKSFRLRQGGVRAQSLARVAHCKVDRFIELTGTPSPNGLQDLWGQAWFLDKGVRLGRSFEAFKARWFQTIQVGNDRHAVRLDPLPFAQEQIEDRMRDLCLSLDARDYFDISQPIVNVIRVELPAKARRMYRDMEREMFLALECGAEVEAFNAASKTIKCLQLANGAIYTDDTCSAFAEIHDAKLQALEGVIEEAAGMPVLVAYHFKSDLARLQRAFPKGRTLDKDPQTIRDWNAGKIPVLFAHPACLHPRTEVLTEYRGWVRIIDVRKDERVFDGVEFVNHKGCSFSGIRPVIEVEGITLTPNHKLLVGGVWLEAKDVRSDPSFRGKAVYAYEGDDSYLGKMLPLSKGKRHNETELRPSKPTAAETLRGMLRGGFSPDDKYPFLGDLASCGQPSDQSIRPRLPSIRGCWSRCFGRLAGFQKLLRGYVRHLPRPSDNRSDQQRFGVLKRKLSMGYECCAAGEQIEQSTADVYGEADAPRRVLSSGECFAGGNNAEIKQRNDARASVRRLSCVEVPKESQVSEVYDLVDCGPRNRFLIRNDDGDVFISHNSAGHGLNLQDGGNILVFFGLNWNLEERLQIIERIGPTRQAQAGHNRPVFIHNIVAADTVDELVLARVDSKREVLDLLLEAMKRKVAK